MKKLYEKFFTESSVPSQWKKAYKELSKEGVDSEHVFRSDSWNPQEYINWAKQYGANLKPNEIDNFAKGYHDFWMKQQLPGYKESVENVSITFLKPVQLHNNRAPAYPNGVVPKGTKVIIDLNQHLGMKERWYVPYTGKGFIKQMKVGSRYGIKLNDAVINELKKRGIVKEEY